MKLVVVLFVSSIVLAPYEALAGIAVSSKACSNWFSKIDKNKDGSISNAENARVYFSKITLSGGGKASDDAHIMQRSFFMKECAIGSFGAP